MPFKEIEEELVKIDKEVMSFFSAVENACKEEIGRTFFVSRQDADRFWNALPEDLQDKSRTLSSSVIKALTEVTRLAKLSPLAGEEDVFSIKIATKTIRSALRLRRYYYREPEILHDEGTIFGFRHADQSDDNSVYPSEARKIFTDQMDIVFDLLELISADVNSNEPSLLQSTLDQRGNYRAGTAFIMMWMDPKQPELNDVADTVKSVFEDFGIRAVRADDIEHESLVTERILNEIKSAEFLFADLTGMRPNVYYEVGYAHALNKRVILFRKNGTDLHFDLAGYNCPDYQNLRDLKEKLTRRLEHVTNKKPNKK